MREASDRDTEAHTGSYKMDGKQMHFLDLSQSCQCYILQKRPVTNLLGLRNWLYELMLFPGQTRLPPIFVWLIQVFLGLLLVRICRQAIAYIVLSYEKGMTVMDQMLTAVLF